MNETFLFQDLQNSCCKRCCFNISINLLFNVRKKYYQLSETARLQYIFDFLKVNQISSNTIKTDYPYRFHINGVDVCKKCWCTLYHISRKKFKHVHESVLVNFVEPHRNSTSFAVQVILINIK